MGLRAVLLAALAAFLLVPAANASAANHFKLNIIGTGSGEIDSTNEFFPAYAGTPPIGCSYTAPGPATGTCENEMAELEEPFVNARGIPLEATLDAGTVLSKWVITKGVAVSPCESGETLCFVGAEEGEGAEATALICLESEPECTPELTLFVNGPSGSGSVTSTPAGINCAAGEECSGEFVGNVTLNATPAAGYVVAGWIGCKQEGGNPATCTVNVNADKEVTAIFLKEGTQGAPGQTPTITPFSGEQHGCPNGGYDVALGTSHHYVCNGKDGTNGTNGTNGAPGPAGPAGATGPQGPPGPAGKVKVTCKMKGKTKVKCTVKNASSSSASRVSWQLKRGGQTVSHGHTSTARLQQVLNGLPGGNYVLQVKGQAPVRLSIG